MAPLVLITRPAGQHEGFARRCETNGFATTLLPCMEIRPTAVCLENLTGLLAVSQTVLFTSANAVNFAAQLRTFPWTSHNVHAIGAATAKVLANAGQAVSLTPQAPYNSEAYLEQLKDQSPGTLLIIKGTGGRGLIQPQLEKRGWQIRHLDVYERVRPVVPVSVIDRLFTSLRPDIISVTSNEILENLWYLCTGYQQFLTQIPLVVNSQRSAERAKALGFIQSIQVAEPAGDTGQLACLLQWKKHLTV